MSNMTNSFIMFIYLFTVITVYMIAGIVNIYFQFPAQILQLSLMLAISLGVFDRTRGFIQKSMRAILLRIGQ